MSSNATFSDRKSMRLKKVDDEFEMEVQRIVNSINDEMKEKYGNVRDEPTDETVTTGLIQTDSKPAARLPTVCRVCGRGTGNEKRYGEIACKSCVNFFHHYKNQKLTKCTKNCEIIVQTRNNYCKYCRLKKYKEEAMRQDEPPTAKKLCCKVCGRDKKVMESNQICRGCQTAKNREYLDLKCVRGNGKCRITASIRKICTFCRNKKYTEIIESCSVSNSSAPPETVQHPCKVCGAETENIKSYGVIACSCCSEIQEEDTSIRRSPFTDRSTPVDSQAKDSTGTRLIFEQQLDGTSNPTLQEQSVEDGSPDFARETPTKKSDGSDENSLERGELDNLDTKDDRLQECDEADPCTISLRDLDIPDYSMERTSADQLVQPSPSAGYISYSENRSIEHLKEFNETLVPTPIVDGKENNIPGCSSVTSPSTNIVHETENNNEKSSSDQSPMTELPTKVLLGNDSMRQEDQNMMMITDAYKFKCRYFELKELRNTLKPRRLKFDTIKDPEERKRQWIYFFYREYSQDLQNILCFLDNVPFLKILSRKEIVAQFKLNSFSIWTVWCLYGIEKKKLIFPNGGYMNREALRSMFRSKVLDRFFKITHDLLKLDLNPTEISFLILFLFSESLELSVSEYCRTILEDLILKRENGDIILIELMKRIEDLIELDGMIKRSKRMTQMIDAIKCLE